MIYSVVYFVPVIRHSLFVICCALIHHSLFVINRSFIFFVVRLFILFPFFIEFCLLLFKREKNNPDPEPCSGISILLAVTCSNIII